jgi:hypothetical protein
MDVAAIIISVISLICSLACLVLMLAKNFFSTHVIQTQMVDPFKDLIPNEIGKPKIDPYQDIDSSLMMGEEDLDALRGRKAKF